MTTALTGCNIALAGTFTKKRDEVIRQMEENGGKFTLNVTRTTTHLLCTKEELDKFSSRVMLAVKYNVPIVSEAWVTDSISDNVRRDESNYLLQVDSVGLEKKIKSDAAFIQHNKRPIKISPPPSPVHNEDDFDLLGTEHNEDSDSPTPATATKSSKRQRIPKDFGDVELPKPRTNRKRPRAEESGDEGSASEESEQTSILKKDVKTMKKEIQYIKKEMQALRNDVTEVLQVLTSMNENKSKTPV